MSSEREIDVAVTLLALGLKLLQALGEVPRVLLVDLHTRVRALVASATRRRGVDRDEVIQRGAADAIPRAMVAANHTALLFGAFIAWEEANRRQNVLVTVAFSAMLRVGRTVTATR